MGYCRSEIAALRVPCLTKGLHLHDSAPDCHHLRLCTVAAMEREDDLAACWGLIAQVKHPASPGALPMSSRVSCCFTGHHRWSWSGLRCLRFPSEFFCPWDLCLCISESSGIKELHPCRDATRASPRLLPWASVTAGPLHRLKPPQGPSSRVTWLG